MLIFWPGKLKERVQVAPFVLKSVKTLVRKHNCLFTLAVISLFAGSLVILPFGRSGGPLEAGNASTPRNGAEPGSGQVGEPPSSARRSLSEPAIPDPEDPFLRKMVQTARKDLANRHSLEVGDIDLLEVREVTWSDASCGCPKPGMVYAQIPQDGLLIRLRLKEAHFSYHSGGTKPPFLCERAPSVPPKEPKIERIDLSSR